jgi:hypothetical protein
MVTSHGTRHRARINIELNHATPLDTASKVKAVIGEILRPPKADIKNITNDSKLKRLI